MYKIIFSKTTRVGADVILKLNLSKISKDLSFSLRPRHGISFSRALY